MRRGAICVSSLRGLAREIRQKASEDSWNSAWPTVNSVPEPVGRAMGGFGLGLRTGQNDRLRSYCRQQVRPALGSSGHDCILLNTKERTDRKQKRDIEGDGNRQGKGDACIESID